MVPRRLQKLDGNSKKKKKKPTPFVHIGDSIGVMSLIPMCSMS